MYVCVCVFSSETSKAESKDLSPNNSFDELRERLRSRWEELKRDVDKTFENFRNKDTYHRIDYANQNSDKELLINVFFIA